MNIQVLETDLARTREEAATLVAAIGDNEPTAAQREQLETLLRTGRTKRAQLDSARGDADFSRQIEALTGRRPAASADPSTGGTRGTWGTQFTTSPGWTDFLRAEKHKSAGMWSSPAIEMQATTITEGAGSGGPLVVPAYQPGVVRLPAPPTLVRALFPSFPTDSNPVIIFREKSFTNAADAVLELGTKPESELVYEQAASPICKYAHHFPVSTEMLEDAPFIASEIDGKLRQGLDKKIAAELLNGTGLTGHLKGILSLTGLAPAVARTTATNVDAIAQQCAAILAATDLTPDAVVINPANFLSVKLLKDSTGNYIVAGTDILRQVWGVDTIVPTKLIAAGTALVGCFKEAAKIYTRGGVRVESTNSHADDFLKNMVRIRGEERLAMLVSLEAAFGTVTGLN